MSIPTFDHTVLCSSAQGHSYRLMASTVYYRT